MRTKTNHVLPGETTLELREETDAEKRNQLMAALRSVGWTLQSIATAAEVSRERVRQIVDDTELDPDHNSVPLPPQKATKPKPVYVEPSEEALAELKRLKPLAEQVRANSTQYREEAEAYSKLIWDTHKPIEDGGEGVTLYRLAKRLETTHGALRFRLARYGYKLPPRGTSKVYKPIKSENRVI